VRRVVIEDSEVLFNSVPNNLLVALVKRHGGQYVAWIECACAVQDNSKAVRGFRADKRAREDEQVRAAEARKEDKDQENGSSDALIPTWHLPIHLLPSRRRCQVRCLC